MSDQTPQNEESPMQTDKSGPRPIVGSYSGTDVVIHPEKDGLTPVTMRLWYFEDNAAVVTRDDRFLHRIRQRWHRPKDPKSTEHDNIGGK